MTTTLVKPSLLIHEICVEKFGNLNLFKFSDRLQDRMELLLEKRKVEQLSIEEIPELETIGELDQIFTHMNAMLAAQNVNL
ncbi:MAG: hypothetical protein DCE90_09925 [Pseudanabaena sp.]|nr:MAG: hypothetical protein DCE90_09925 [Pseudanabaena sp.]